MAAATRSPSDSYLAISAYCRMMANHESGRAQSCCTIHATHFLNCYHAVSLIGSCDFFSRRARESEAKIAADDLGGIAPGRHGDAGARVTAGAAEIKVADRRAVGTKLG